MMQSVKYSLFRFLVMVMLITLVTENKLLAHEYQKQDNGTVPVIEILNKLQEIHSVRIFYDYNWFINDSVRSAMLSLPLEKALDELLSWRKMEVTTFNQDLIILPLEEPARVTERTGGQVVVGNPYEYGKYTNAEITGKIIDLLTGDELIGVIVYVDELNKGTTTDQNGNFSLELPVGDHRLTISYMGYETDSRYIRLVAPGRMDITLAEDSQLLEEVTIYAKREDANISSTRMSLITMDSRTIFRLPTSIGEKDVLKSLTLLPGVQTIGEFGTGFHVRGGSADQNLILVEGVPVFNSSHLFGLTSLINPDMVSDITFITGGIPAKYGERSSSVMDIRLGDSDVEKIDLSGGIGLLNSRLTFKTPIPLNNGYIMLGGRSSYSNWLLNRMPDEDLMQSSANFYDLSGVAFLPVSQSNNVTLFGYHSKDGFAFSDNVHYNYESTLGSLRWNSIISEKLSSTLLIGHSGYFYNVNDSSSFNPNNSFALRSKINYNTVKWNFNYYVSSGSNLEVGLNGIHYNVEPGTRYPFGPQSTITRLKLIPENAVELAGYINGDFQITENISSEIGLRYTRYLRLGPGDNRIYQEDQPVVPSSLSETVSYEENEVMADFSGYEPRVSMRYQFNPSTSLKMSYYRINQYINLVSNTSLPTPADLWYLSNSHQPPMQTDQFALGYFRNFDDNSIETSVELYYKNMSNIPEPRNNAQIMLNPTLETEIISTKGYSYGAELYVRKPAGKYNGWVSYTYSQSRRRTYTPFINEQINSNNYFPAYFDKPHNLVINASVQLKRRWRAGSTFSYSTGRPVTLPELGFFHDGGMLIYFSDRNKYRLPDYHRLDLSISFDGSLRIHHRWRSSWTLSLVNVYGRKNVYSTFYERTDRSRHTNYQEFSLYKMYIIARPLPTLTYNFTF
jgi:hypothetical protein